MTAVDTAIFCVNLGGALSAAAANLYAVVRPGPFAMWRPLRAAIGVLALFYAAGYAAVLAGLVPVAHWSAFYRGVSPVAWAVVWCGPIVITSHIWRQAKRDAAVAVERMRAEALSRGV